MQSDKSILEWVRIARKSHVTTTVALPREVIEKWKLGNGSTLTVSLLEDGSLKIRPSEKELEFQERMQRMEVVKDAEN